MYPNELITISDDESDESVVEIPQNTSAPVPKSNVNDINITNTSVKLPIVINGFENAKKEQIRLAENSGFVNDDEEDYNFLMEELTHVINSCKSNLEQNSCPNASDSYIVPEITEEHIEESNLRNDISERNSIKILNVESLNHRINLWMNYQQQKFIPLAVCEGQEESAENFRNVVASDDRHEVLNSKFSQPNEFLELEYGNSSNNFSNRNDPWMKTQINKHELTILNKYLPMVRLDRLSLQKNSPNLENVTEDPLKTDNVNNTDHDSKSFIHKNIMKKKHSAVGTDLSNVKNENQGIFEFSCENCVKTFYSEDAFQMHIKYRHTGCKPYKCNDCDYVTNVYKSLETHRWTHTSIRPHRCLLCSYGSKTRQSLNSHIRRIHTNERPFVCSHSQCKFAGATSQDLKHHIERKHTTKNYYRCNTCGFESISRSRLNNHRCRSQVRFACSECNYCCLDLKDLKVHVKTHTIKKLFECMICPFSTPYKCDLNNHLKQHKGLSFKCEICSLRFSNQDLLNKHKYNYHTLFPSNRVVKCSFCEVTFTNKFNMMQHVKAHKYKNLQKCSECLYTTPSVEKFQKHKHDHASNRLFICNDCSKSFNERKLIQQHRLNFHSTINNF